uniref:Uncharacterized protein n=1 Tax=Brassica oleracea var. oleracea TaxID=109376 RepID=A0A0D3AVC8_BRAOL
MLQLLLQLQSYFKVMGNTCCVAPRDKMILLPNSSSAAERRHSPTWSFRWDNNNRGRVAGEEALSVGCLMGLAGTMCLTSNLIFYHLKVPLWTAFGHRRCRSLRPQKEKDLIESAAPSYPSPAQLSLSLASQPSSFPTSPLPSQIYYHPASSSTLNPTQQVSDGKICGMNSLSRSSATEEEEKGTPFRVIHILPQNKKKRRTDLEALTKNQAAVHIQSDSSQAFSLFMNQYLNVIVVLRWFPY